MAKLKFRIDSVGAKIMSYSKAYRFARNAFYFIKGFDADRFSAPVHRIKTTEDVYWIQEISEKSKVNFIISIEKCIWGAGFRYSADTHPFANAMTSDNAFDLLKRFYKNYSPKNIFDLYLLDSENGQFFDESLVKPWNNMTQKKTVGEGGIKAEEGVQHYGPCSDRKVKFEADRCISICRKIKQEGFWPQRFAGYPRGYFLVSGNDFLFQITGSGQHRTAALAALGWEQVQCTSWNRSVRIVDSKDIEKWPGVRENRVSSKDALKIFERNFSKELMKRHRNLLKKN